MFALINGKPKFYIGKINGIGYVDNKGKEGIIKQLQEKDSDVEIIEEVVEIDKDLKDKAIALGELQLTYSKSEFMKYLTGEKTVPEVAIHELIKENQKLKEELAKQVSTNRTAMVGILELANRVRALEGDLDG